MKGSSNQNAIVAARGRAVLALLFALALLSGGTSAPDRAAGLGQLHAVFDEAVLGSILGHVNPSLGDHERARIAAAVLRYSAAYGLDPELVTAVLVVESGARPWALSPKGAVGLMQVMPHMMQPLGLAGNPATIETNIEAGCVILADNIERLGEERGISAYFWGSRIRGLSYLEKVREARAEVRRLRPS